VLLTHQSTLLPQTFRALSTAGRAAKDLPLVNYTLKTYFLFLPLNLVHVARHWTVLFSKVLPVIILCSKYTKALTSAQILFLIFFLTFENFCQEQSQSGSANFGRIGRVP
jgi:hypothetical protein